MISFNIITPAELKVWEKARKLFFKNKLNKNNVNAENRILLPPENRTGLKHK